jgi:XTP/dITP diphosphohydrolase
MRQLPVLVCASANPDKVVEIAAILNGVVTLLPRPSEVPDVVEDADTLEGNARLKAAAICAATGMAAVADDTGLEVAALDGAPGVYAARYAGEGCSYADNRRKLLRELGGVVDRSATFRTCVVVSYPDGSELVVDGECRGTITMVEQGARGFGYDAVFAPDDADGRTFGEMTDDEKNALSHRGRAFRNLLDALRD